jgi:hypothetical protein
MVLNIESCSARHTHAQTTRRTDGGLDERELDVGAKRRVLVVRTD